jgi:Protein of unknown function (DUF4236)
MGFRFRRRISIAPGAAINLSRSGPSLSLDPRGAHGSGRGNGLKPITFLMTFLAVLTGAIGIIMSLGLVLGFVVALLSDLRDLKARRVTTRVSTAPPLS